MKSQPIKNPFPTPIRSLRVRQNRRVITVLANGFRVLAIVFAFAQLGYLALGAIAISVALAFVLQFATRNLANAIEKLVITDEYERQLRDKAHLFSYWVTMMMVCGIVGAVSGYLFTQDPNKPIMLVKNYFKIETLTIIFAVIAIIISLPTSFIAWLEPDLIAD